MVDIRGVLQQYNFQPSKGLGQNFLVADWVYNRILEASDLGPNDLVLEIGSGLGTLTERLAECAGEIVAVELDSDLLRILHDRLGGRPNVHLIQEDILELDLVDAMRSKGRVPSDIPLQYKVVANLPYYLTSSVLRYLLTAEIRPKAMTLMVQWEVAQRITADFGDLSLLALSVQVFGHPYVVCRVPAKAFYPEPSVASAVLQVDLYESPVINQDLLPLFFKAARAAFQQRRKQLHNSLAHGLSLNKDIVDQILAQADIDARRRPQALSLADWKRLVSELASFRQ